MPGNAAEEAESTGRFTSSTPNGTVDDFNLGAHVPRLADADVDLIHTLWLDATKEGGVEDLHHKEIVTVALARLAEE